MYNILYYTLLANVRVRRVVHGGLQRVPADAGHQAGESVHRPGDGLYALGTTGVIVWHECDCIAMVVCNSVFMYSYYICCVSVSNVYSVLFKTCLLSIYYTCILLHIHTLLYRYSTSRTPSTARAKCAYTGQWR